MEKSIIEKPPATQAREYVIWKGFFPDEEPLLAEASRENGLVPKHVGDVFAVYRLRRAQLRDILGKYFSDGYMAAGKATQEVGDDSGPQIRIPEGKGRGILEGYELTPETFGVSMDVPLSVSEYSGNRNAVPDVGVHDRRQAEALIGADALRAYSSGGCNPVNVVIIDGGLDADYLASLGYTAPIVRLGGSKPFGTGLTRRPGQRHANAVARNVLALAPHVRLHDLNLLPDRINRVDTYASDLALPLIELGARIMKTRRTSSWVIVCPWGLMDTAYDLDTGTFARSRYHFLSLLFSYLVSSGADVVFSAGNNGLFWPDVFSGALDRGPGRSIYGTNGLEEVLTVGAVDALGQWCGTSSQGPEPRGLRIDPASRARKPDVCAPSGFYETHDRHERLNGTSGACAVAAGVVASLRRKVPQADLSSARLIALMRKTARTEGLADGRRRDTPAQFRLGSGVIDGAALVEALSAQFP